MFTIASRRVAQWQSASKYTEEAAWFESCSAYQSSPHVLFLSHCVPNPPDKGEKIRAFYLLNHLAERWPVHLVCFARSPREIEDARALLDRCRSIYVEVLPPVRALARAAVSFAFGNSLTTSFYASGSMMRHVGGLRQQPLGTTLVFSSAMAQYAPPDVPLLMDMVDVDSEKWFNYAQFRWPGAVFNVEGRRLRAVEKQWTTRARCTYVAARQEEELLRGIVPDAAIQCVENGVNFDYFAPPQTPPPDLARRRFIVFVGAMSYYPNVDACCWFADAVFPKIQERFPDLEFLIVGRDPAKPVRKLAARRGISVTGTVADVRPYIAAASAVVAPLRIARGIQNKVLEALAMGKPVLASNQVCATFGADVPAGIIRCASAEEFADACSATVLEPFQETGIRKHTVDRFCWEKNMREISETLDMLLAASTLEKAGAGS